MAQHFGIGSLFTHLYLVLAVGILTIKSTGICDNCFTTEKSCQHQATEDRFTVDMTNSNKISPVVLQELAAAPHTEILVSLKSDTSAVLDQLASTNFATRGERATAVSNALKEHAEREQKPLLDYLKGRGLEVQSMWINNQIFVKGAKKEDVEWLAARDEVKEVKENGRIVLDDPIVADPQ